MKKPQFKIKYSIILTLTIISILFAAIFLVAGNMYAYCSKMVVDKTLIYQKRTLDDVSDTVYDFLNSIDTVAASIGENSEIMQLLSEDSTDRYNAVTSSRQISSILSTFVYSDERLARINIVTNRFSDINDLEMNGMISEQYVSDTMLNNTLKIGDKGWFVFSDSDITQGYYGTQERSTEASIGFYRNIYQKSANRRLGMIIISCRENALYEMIKRSIIDVNAEAMIVNENGIIISHSDKSQIGTTYELQKSGDVLFDKSKGELFISSRIPQYNWTIVQNLNVQSLIGELDGALKFTLVISVAVMCIAALLSIALSAAITHPLRQLSENVKNVPQSTMYPNESTFVIKEVDSLNTHFKEMVDDIRQLIARLSAEQNEKHTAQLRLLHAEINPHFIYNTIELINYVAAKNNEPVICEIVHSFGKFLRLSLNNGKDYLTVAQEIEHVKNYLYLQAFKLEDSFSVEWDIQLEAMSGYTLKLLLQPLVENCLIHGFGARGGEGCIVISAIKSNNNIIFSVCDNGKGIQDETAATMLTRQTKGYGVYNVHQRIKTAFGEGFGLRYEQLQQGGTKAEITIPFLETLPQSDEITGET